MSEKLDVRHMTGTQLIAYCEALEQERDHLETVFSELGIAFDDLKREYETLKEQLGFKQGVIDGQNIVTNELKEQLGIVENACQDWRDKAESAEAEVKRLSEQKFFEIKCSPELEKRLAELALDNLEKGERLAKAQELADKWIASKGGLTTYIRAGENLEKALKGASE